jgi:hypothetical protein
MECYKNGQNIFVGAHPTILGGTMIHQNIFICCMIKTRAAIHHHKFFSSRLYDLTRQEW